MKTPRVTLHRAAVTSYKSDYSGVDRVALGSHRALFVAVARFIRRRLQRLALVGGEERQDLLVVRPMLFPSLGATGRLRRGELGDFCLLVVRQLHRLDELQGLFEAMHGTGGIRAAGGRRRVGCRHRWRGAGSGLV